MTAAQITWDDLREVPLRDLQPGDRWITLAAFTVCWVSPDGRVRGSGYGQPRGTVWTLDGWAGDTATATSDDGEKRSQQIPAGTAVTQVVTAGGAR
ncbi:hypothetical protein [Catenuloplanes japonicus]|uniref:hypothetical protein n=1 Tax=Catenuloplanes japonicus TaxID=33876 RepID=UPI0005242849|nr:hypothetical protein [Catenuloplanes japonicus]